MDPVRRAEPVPALEQAVQAARLDMVFSSQPMTLAVSVALAVIVVAVLWPHQTGAHLAIWFGVLASVSRARVLFCRRYARERKGGHLDFAAWERRFETGCLLGGAAWGCSALLLFPSEFVLQGFLAFVLAGVTSGAIAELSVAPRMARAFIIPGVTPLALRFFVEGDALHVSMGVMTVMYVMLITAAMRRGQVQLRRTVAAQLDARATRQELSETNQRVDVMKTEFFSVVSHELRTPLTALRGAIGLLGNELAAQLTARQLQLLELANRNTDRLGVMIDDLLDIERIESGVLTLVMQDQLLRALIERAITSVSPYAVSQSIELSLKAPAVELWVSADAQRFLQVMQNLLSNAVKFSNGGTVVDVSLVHAAGRARIEVRDYGPGIPKSMQPYIFSKFCQGDASDSRRRGGTGLGLAISKAIVERMGGNIGYETREGNGTTFFFELPTCEARSEHAA